MFEVTKGMVVEKLPPFPPGSNPFQQDRFHMGVEVGDMVIMYPDLKKLEYLILVDKPSGERIRVTRVREVLRSGGEKMRQAELMEQVYKGAEKNIPEE